MKNPLTLDVPEYLEMAAGSYITIHAEMEPEIKYVVLNEEMLCAYSHNLPDVEVLCHTNKEVPLGELHTIQEPDIIRVANEEDFDNFNFPTPPDFMPYDLAKKVQWSTIRSGGVTIERIDDSTIQVFMPYTIQEDTLAIIMCSSTLDSLVQARCEITPAVDTTTGDDSHGSTTQSHLE